MSDVTVLVVAYNHQRFIEECLDSIRTQEFPASRVLIADDSSNDGTQATIQEYLDSHNEFRAEFLPNAQNIGLTKTLNKLLSQVTTTYVTYISADDYMLQGRLYQHEKLMDSNPDAALAYSDAIVVDEDSEVLESSSKVEFPWPDEPDRSESTFEMLLEQNWIPAASFFLRTETLKAAGGYCEDIFYEDAELLIRLAKHAPFVYVDRPLVAVRRLSTSLGATGFRSTNPQFIRALNLCLIHYADADSPLRERALAKRWELAKRAARTDMPLSEVLSLMLASWRAARSPAAAFGHMARATLRKAPPKFRVNAPAQS